ncbi:MAG: flagellar biosynthesis protein FlhB [Bacteroidales bacterium]|nr:flagellar biosynthesis protein FlhB [Clostridium sp.]MCM1202741.1 flagellar biosynthesis protein FlhB [Bacteroidales bacterium]
MFPYDEYRVLLPLDLQLFAKEGPGGEKTEDATSKKLEDVREEGNVAKSTEITTAAVLLALFVCLKFTMGFVGGRLMQSFNQFYSLIPRMVNDRIRLEEFTYLLVDGIFFLGITILPFLLFGAVVAFFSTSLQFKFKVTAKPLQPKFSKLNPINGFKRMFSLNTLMELLKSIVKIGFISYIVYGVFTNHARDIYLLYDMSLSQSILLMYDIALELLIKICMLFIVIAAADFLYQRWKFKQDNKMTKQEVKDEYKNQEGDPKVKGQQRQRMQQASQRRMMAAIPEADVVITNPTHFAVALSYKSGQGQAPVVVAKGADFLAGRIKDIARESRVEIVENKSLARMLYYNVELGAEIPPELYQAVAEVLAYVYRLHNRVS